MHIPGARGRIHIKYEVFMSKPVARRVCTDDTNNKVANDDAQSMII